MELIDQYRCHGGWVQRYTHKSTVTNSTMTFGLFLPPTAEQQTVPVLYWLSGLTCTDENFLQKSGAFKKAATLGLAIVCPDTSPRGDHVADADPFYLGQGAGYYVNATQAPWNTHYQMYDYITIELPELIRQSFPVNDQCSISGHSMGGHGALVVGLREHAQYQSISAFAPITNPSNCPWGKQAFSALLGENEAHWQAYDSCQLVQQASVKRPLLVDQGSKDQFLEEQLKPNALAEACRLSDYPLELRMREGYDHSYYFVSSFIDEHLEYHAKHLNLK